MLRMVVLCALLAAATSLAEENMTADEILLRSQRGCLRDPRGGPYSYGQNEVLCRFDSNIPSQPFVDIRCLWRSKAELNVTFRLHRAPAGGPDSPEAPAMEANCSAIRRVVVLLPEGELYEADYDHGLLPPMPGPAAFLHWRRWLQSSRPARIVIKRVAERLPSFRDIDSMRHFFLLDSHEYFPRGTDKMHVLPELPESLELLSLRNNELRRLPLSNHSLSSLRRLDVAHNQFLELCWDTEHDLQKWGIALEELDLSYNGIAYSDCSNELEQRFPKLRWLDISHNRITVSLRDTKYPGQLTFWNFSYNEGVYPLPSPELGPTYPNLKVLDLSYCKPSVTTDRFWDMSIAFPNLTVLYATGYDDVHLSNLHLEYLKMIIPGNRFPLISNSTIATLDLSESNIQYLKNIHLNNTFLRRLDLSYNHIERWEDDSVFGLENSVPWVEHVNLSHNGIRMLLPQMLRSFEALSSVDLGRNPYECNNCSVGEFHSWFPNHTRLVRNLNSSIPLMCSSPWSMRNRTLNDTEFYREFCVPRRAFWSAIPLGVIAVLAVVQAVILYRFRLQIVFMMHMYKLRVRRAKDEADGCTHDVFVCYSSADRLFVMQTLTPFIEEPAPEKYSAYVHERAFTLGSDINTNIVEAIERSRRALLVVSQAFLKSEFCKKEYDMVTHRAFDGSPRYMVLLRYGPLRKEALPRALRLYMTTTTYLEWPDDIDQLETLEVRKRLVEALGRSLHQRRRSAAGTEGEADDEEEEEEEARAPTRARRLLRLLRGKRKPRPRPPAAQKPKATRPRRKPTKDN